MLKPVADGMIVGSAIIRQIAEAHPDEGAKSKDEVIVNVNDFAKQMLSAT